MSAEPPKRQRRERKAEKKAEEGEAGKQETQEADAGADKAAGGKARAGKKERASKKAEKAEKASAAADVTGAGKKGGTNDEDSSGTKRKDAEKSAEEKTDGNSAFWPSGKKRRNKLEDTAAEVDPAAEEDPAAEKWVRPAAPAVTEDIRRTAQRELQQLVTRMMKEGKSKEEIDQAKYELRGKFGGSLHQPTSSYVKKKEAWLEKLQSKEGQEQVQENRTKEHELVVIPVFWRGRSDKLDVVKAAEDIKAVVAQQGVDVWVDARRHYTPGQKFAHWEHRGVMLRIEIGPEDLEAGVCRLCLAKTPGEYKTVERKRARLPPAGTRSLLLALKEFGGLKQIEVERREGDSADEEEAEEAAKDVAAGMKVASKDQNADEEEDAEVQGNWAPKRVAEKGAKKSGKKAKGNKKLKRRRCRLPSLLSRQ